MSIEKYEGARGTSWRIRWIDHTGARVGASFGNEADARKALRLREAEADQIRAGLRAPPSATHTFEELVALFLAERRTGDHAARAAREDRAVIEAHFTPVLTGMDVRQIGREQISMIRTRLHAARISTSGPTRHQPDPAGSPYAKRTQQKILTLLGSLLRTAAAAEWIDRVPVIAKPRPDSHAVKRAWLRTSDEIDRLLTAAADLDREDDEARERGQAIRGAREIRTHPMGVHPLYSTAIRTGMRLGELAALRWTDVDLQRGWITVCRSHDAATTKGKQARTVPILDVLMPTLVAWRERSPGPHVFPNVCGHQRGTEDRVFRETLHRALARAGIPRRDADGMSLSFHSLRHTWASHLALAGVDLFRLQKMGGWKSHAMVQVYAHLLPDAFEGVRGLMRPAGGVHVSPPADSESRSRTMSRENRSATGRQEETP